jgi:vacuolar protein sorting-associated protein 72
MSLSSQRERRTNAGLNMTKLLNEELEEDEFYKTAYGGFSETEEDHEFDVNDEEQEVDYVDSDFDIDEDDENDQVLENQYEDEPVRKKPFKGYKISKSCKYKVIKYLVIHCMCLFCFSLFF